MTPKYDNSQAVANTLAIIQGRESYSTIMNELSREEYQMAYDEALELDKLGYFALLFNESYTTIKHNPKWVRRVR